MYITKKELLQLKETREYKRINENYSRHIQENKNEYDIFLSHATKDIEIMKLVKAYFEKQGKSVYVAELEDFINTEEITEEFAKILQQRMNISKQFCYVLSEGSTKSYWMPWELGYYDGEKGAGKISVLTVHNNDIDEEKKFIGHEYLKLYPHEIVDSINAILQQVND